MGLVGPGQWFSGLGWVGLDKLDPRTTLRGRLTVISESQHSARHVLIICAAIHVHTKLVNNGGKVHK